MMFFIIAGPNGAGKTTVASPIMLEIGIDEYVNTDNIAKGMSMLHPERLSFSAGRVAIKRMNRLINERVSFAYETTLASKSINHIVERARETGYEITLCFYALPTVSTAIKRVKHRVELGGHDVPTNIILRRYERGLMNFFTRDRHKADNWFFYNNLDKATLLAYKTDSFVVLDPQFEAIRKRYEGP